MAASNVVFVTVTDRTTISQGPGPTSLATQVPSGVSTISSLITSTASSISVSVSSSVPSQSFTTLPPSTSVTAAPSTTTTASHAVLPNNTVAEIVLASIILICILFIGMIALGLLLWFRGRCPNCSDMGHKGLEAGAQKRITVDMVKVREGRTSASQRQSMLTVSDHGHGHGQNKAEGQGAQAHHHHTEALNNLNSRRPTRYEINLDGEGIRETLWPDGMKDDVSVRSDTPGPESGLGHGNAPPPPAKDRASSLYTAGMNMPAAPPPAAHHTGLGAGAGNQTGEAASYYNPKISMYSTDRYGAPVVAPAYKMESIPSTNPDAQAYRNAAAAAADKNNPDAEDAKRYADQLLVIIRNRELKAKGKRTYADLPRASDFSDFDSGLGSPKTGGFKWKVKNPFL